MTRTHSFLFALCLLPIALQAQTPASSNAAVELLTGGSTRDWTIIGTPPSTTGTCAAGEITYTFSRAPAQVVIKECVGGAWSPRTVPYTLWSASGKEGIAYAGVSYEVKELRSGAPVCKGNNTCIRLASLPDGKTDAAKLIYLTR